MIHRLALGALWLAMLAACAASGPIASPGTRQPVQFNTGRLTVWVTDQNGQPLQDARVDVDADLPDFYRNTAFLDRRGTASFNGVPRVVRVTVVHPYGYYSAPYVLPETGIAEMRMIVLIDYPPPEVNPPEQQQSPAPRFPGRAPAR